jgi:hypothetical protein
MFATITYQTRTEPTIHGSLIGEVVTPTSTSKSITRKIKLVKTLDTKGWTEDMETLQGKNDEHIVKQIQMDLVEFDLQWWEFLEQSLLRTPASTDPSDDEPMFGFDAWVTAKTSPSNNEFDLYGGKDPYNTGRPGNISIATESEYTNPYAKFQAASDNDLFDKFEEFLSRRKLMPVVPNPGLIPDTPNDVGYFNLQVIKAVQRYLTAGNENIGMDAGRYRGASTYKEIPLIHWHASDQSNSPVKETGCIGRVIDWNSFRYSVEPSYDRRIKGPTDVNLAPSSVYVTSETWHQIVCDRPDRNLYLESDTAEYQVS